MRTDNFWTVENKDEVETILIRLFSNLGMDTPENLEDITQFCYEDVGESADPINWNSGDVTIALRRWIEKNTSVSAEYIEKAKKWDALEANISDCYGHYDVESGNWIENTDNECDLSVIGEITAKAFKFL